jgi:O-acetyl-ADP-ribose deacetylase (regulator of RNase III)
MPPGPTIELVKGDITSLPVDAIVNAANESLQLGAGVAGAIRRSGGSVIQRECDRIGHCETGGAVVTGGGDLPARWVIHAVGPVWRGGGAGEERLLASAVASALRRAEEIGAKSVALPALSTGVYGFPMERAAEISLRGARLFASSARSVERIVFCLFGEEAFEAFEKARTLYRD